DANDISAQKEAEGQIRVDKCFGCGGQNEGQSTTRRCGTCEKTNHNARTCQGDIKIP
ncbi:hypothetical protein BKA61DRAFT_452585, partial [Leptodontidium sp. MPI-SDFR-AT-0119]